MRLSLEEFKRYQSGTKAKPSATSSNVRRERHDDVLAACLQVLALCGATVTESRAELTRDKKGEYRFSGRVKKGWPDGTAVMPPYGTILGVEVKTLEYPTVSQSQLETHREIRSSGGFVAVVFNTDELIDFLDAEFIRWLERVGTKECLRVAHTITDVIVGFRRNNRAR
jgi:hypothetical protein